MVWWHFIELQKALANYKLPNLRSLLVVLEHGGIYYSLERLQEKFSTLLERWVPASAQIERACF